MYDYFSRLSAQTGGQMFTGETISELTDAVLGDIYESGPPPIIRPVIDINPNTLNLKSEGRWITCYIELPLNSDYGVSEIDISTVRLNDVIAAETSPTTISDYDSDGLSDLMVKFDRSAVQDLLEPGEQTLIITGKMEGTTFMGSDVIRAILPGKEKDPNHPK